ncbi:MAG: N-acetylmuramoyl-L-alanine amidase [Deltaproteobacteria bacterium]|nr:N-acetylmuramoyl-L-alanine amidase [Deltaproteobacteria bacterium]
MKISRFLFALGLSLIISAGGHAFSKTEETYENAHNCYVDLKADPEARKLRQSWEKCIDLFERVARQDRRIESGADAKFSLGKLYEELAENSKNQSDWLKAAKEYESFARQYSRNSKADDAYFGAGKIYWLRLNDKANSKRCFSRVVKFYKKGDKAAEANKYLAALETGILPKDADAVSQAGSIQEAVTIVIDPGHGGKDAGAIGPKGTEKKDVTLSLSKKLAEQIKNDIKGAKVFLTRGNDATLTLDDRVKFANKKRADLFISIHANAAVSKKQRGVQTYFLNNASDDAARRQASDLEKIISTMIQNASTEESRILAKSVHHRLVKDLSGKYSGVADQKVRSAMFYVLVGVKCPSILVETSYVSNPKEEARLNNKDYQATIAKAVAKGLDEHLKSKKSLAINL